MVSKYADFLSAGVTENDFDSSTFELVDVPMFRNFKFGTLFWYCWTWIFVALAVGVLGIDSYTCVNLLAFNRWSNDDVKPYRFDIAKWLFSGCILFQFCLIGYHWIVAYGVLKKKKIAQTYLNAYAKNLYVLRSYNYHCLFHALEPSNFFDWCAFLVYDELDVAIQLLVIDSPRQVINVMTLVYYATDGDTSNDVISNIKEIATTNLKLAIILSLMVVSLAIYSIFMFRFILGILLYLPIKIKTHRRGFKRIKKYCVHVINWNTRKTVKKYHKPRQQLLETGVMSLEEMKMNPLLNSSTTFFEDFEYVQDPKAYKMDDIEKRHPSDPFADPSSYDRLPPQITPDQAYVDKQPFTSSSELTYTSELPFSDSKALNYQTSTSYLGATPKDEKLTLDVSKLDLHKLEEAGSSKERLFTEQPHIPMGMHENESQNTIPSSFSTNWSQDGVDADLGIYSETSQQHQRGEDQHHRGYPISEEGDFDSSFESRHHQYEQPGNFQPPPRTASGTTSLVYSSTIASPPSYNPGLNRIDSVNSDELSFTGSSRFNAPPPRTNTDSSGWYTNSNDSQDSQRTFTFENGTRPPPAHFNLNHSHNLNRHQNYGSSDSLEETQAGSQEGQNLYLPYPTRGPSLYEDRYK